MTDFLETIFEIFGWIRIVLSPTFIGSLIGVFIYYGSPNSTSYIIAIILAGIGFVIGFFWANRIWKKYGTMQFLSRVDASPDFDNIEDEKKK